MREMYDFLRLASRLSNPFGHPSQVRTQVLVLQTCIMQVRLAKAYNESTCAWFFECYNQKLDEIQMNAIFQHATKTLSTHEV